jgi:hypothetical protein
MTAARARDRVRGMSGRVLRRDCELTIEVTRCVLRPRRAARRGRAQLVLLYVGCGEPFVLRVLASYDGPADAGLLERIRLRARWNLLNWIARALQDDRAAIPRCLARFDHVFPP